MTTLTVGTLIDRLEELHDEDDEVWVAMHGIKTPADWAARDQDGEETRVLIKG